VSNEEEDEWEDEDEEEYVQYRRILGIPRLMKRSKKMIIMRYDITRGIVLHFELEE